MYWRRITANALRRLGMQSKIWIDTKETAFQILWHCVITGVCCSSNDGCFIVSCSRRFSDS